MGGDVFGIEGARAQHGRFGALSLNKNPTNVAQLGCIHYFCSVLCTTTSLKLHHHHQTQTSLVQESIVLYCYSGLKFTKNHWCMRHEALTSETHFGQRHTSIETPPEQVLLHCKTST